MAGMRDAKQEEKLGLEGSVASGDSIASPCKHSLIFIYNSEALKVLTWGSLGELGFLLSCKLWILSQNTSWLGFCFLISFVLGEP